MAISKRPYRGTRDFFPKEQKEQDFLFLKMHEIANQFNYEHYNGPMLEEVELYKAKSGDELINEQIYSFEDRGKRFVAIRPEMTPTVARMVAQVYRETPRPIRWYSIPNLMRYERPQKGRLREHWQLNCDIFGAPSPWGECEIIEIAISLLRSFGGTSEHFQVRFNDRKILDFFSSKVLSLNSEKSFILSKKIDHFLKFKEDDFQKSLKELLLTQEQNHLLMHFLQNSSLQEIKEKWEQIDHLNKEDLDSLFLPTIKMVEYFENLGLSEYLFYAPYIVRGLDYYTGIVFEIFDRSPENPRAICGGGSYENLLGIFNEGPMPGAGFGLGDVTLKEFLLGHDLLDINEEGPDFLLAPLSDECRYSMSSLAQRLRNSNMSVHFCLAPMKLKKLFQYAEKRKAKFLLFMGDDELNGKEGATLQVKNIKTRDGLVLPLDDLEGILKLI